MGTLRLTRRKSGFLYSLASFGLGLVAYTFSTYIGFFYIDQVGLPPRWVGWGLFLFSVWNAVNDPLLGLLSDRTHTRWGRRVPYIAIASIPFSLCFTLLWSPPSVQPLYVFLWFLVLTMSYDAAYSLAHLNVTALFPEMFATLAERARVSVWRQWWSSLGLLAASALTPLLLRFWSWAQVGATYAGVAASTLWLSLLGSVETGAYSQLGSLPWREALWVALRNSAFLIYLGILFTMRMGMTLVVAVLPFYTRYVLAAPTEALSRLFGVPIVLALILMPLWRRIVEALGARRSLVLAATLAALGTLGLTAANDVPSALGMLAIAGGGLSGLFITPDILLADIVDEDFVRQRKRREGAFVGVSNFVTRLPNPLQALLVAEVLERTGYVAAATSQPPATIWGLRVLTGLIPALAMAVTAFLGWLYPLDGARLAEVKAQARALRREVEGMS